MPTDEGPDREGYDEYTSVPAREFITHLLDTREYCIFEVEGMEWHFVFKNLIERWRPEGERPPPTFDDPGNFGILYANPRVYYWIKRGAVPTPDLAGVLGLEKAEVEKALFIRLNPIVVEGPPPPEPTVDYYGLA